MVLALGLHLTVSPTNVFSLIGVSAETRRAAYGIIRLLTVFFIY